MPPDRSMDDAEEMMGDSMAFEIQFDTDEIEMMAHVVEAPRPVLRGHIKIGVFQELIYCTLDEWRRSDYEAQWRRAKERLARGMDSCFVVGVHPPEMAGFIECWIVWRLKSEFRVQNQPIFYEEGPVVDPHHPYAAIRPYRNRTEDGDRITDDWGLPLDTFTEE